MAAAANQGFTTATDLADYLVRNHVPFRDAHEIVGRTVAHAIAEGKNLEDLSLAELQRFGGNAVDQSVFDVLRLEGSVAARNHVGGTAPAQVRAAVQRARGRL